MLFLRVWFMRESHALGEETDDRRNAGELRVDPRTYPANDRMADYWSADGKKGEQSGQSEQRAGEGSSRGLLSKLALLAALPTGEETFK